MNRIDRTAAQRTVTAGELTSLRQAIRVGFTVAFTVLAVGACAQPVTVDPKVVTATSAQLADLSARFEGTPTQRRAGELLEYHLYQDPIVSCMAGKGFSYTAPPFVDPYAGLTDLDHFDAANETWLGHLDRQGLGVATDAVNLAPLDHDVSANPGFTNLDPAGQKRYDAALNGCIPTGPMTDVNFPLSSIHIKDRLLRMFGDIAKDSQVADKIQQYAPCMRSAGFDVKNPEEVVELLQRDIGAIPHDAIGKPGRAEWAAAVNHEGAAAAADSRCRKDAHDVAMMLLSTRLDDFERDNAADLAQAGKDWIALVAEAANYPEAAKLGLK